jgi:hypothetical protein
MKILLFSVLFVVALMLSRSTVSACDGHYETRYQTVLVCDGHYESRWVYAPLYNCGRRLREGYYINAYVPARYTIQAVNVWVEDRPRYAYARPYCGDREGYTTGSFFINIKGVFGFR